LAGTNPPGTFAPSPLRGEGRDERPIPPWSSIEVHLDHGHRERPPLTSVPFDKLRAALSPEGRGRRSRANPERLY
jgi:hypothetical protein